jgi:acetylornithine deacetylase/succinyl-diaminopimelate desuccinylase-like protein
MEEMAAMVVASLQELGAETTIVPTAGQPVLVGHLAGESPQRLMIYDHYDVQPPEPLDAWLAPPFDAAIQDGYLYARGVSDNKGNLVARLWAARAWREIYGTLPCHVTFLFEGEEEIGSPNLEDFAASHQDIVKADACLWESGYRDAQGALGLHAGAKGLLYVELRVHTVAFDLHSSNAPIAPNAAWRLLEALATLRDPSGHVRIPHFYDAVLQPNERERELMARFPINVSSYQQNWHVQHLLGPEADPIALTQHLLFEPTCNICGIWSGYSGPGSKTILPATAAAKLDFRLVPNQDPETILALLEQHLREQGFADVEVVEIEHGERPAQSPVDTPLMETLIRSARYIYGIEPRVLPRTAGTGPMEQLCLRYGVPAVGGAGVGYYGSRNHAPNENIKLDDFVLGIKHAAAILAEFAA